MAKAKKGKELESLFLQVSEAPSFNLKDLPEQKEGSKYEGIVYLKNIKMKEHLVDILDASTISEPQYVIFENAITKKLREIGEHEFAAITAKVAITEIGGVLGKTLIIQDAEFYCTDEEILAERRNEYFRESIERRKVGAERFKQSIASGEKLSNNTFMEGLASVVKRQFNVDETEIPEKVGTNLRAYMNNEELKNFIWLAITAGFGDYYLNESAKYGNITEEEYQSLDNAVFFLRLYSDSKLKRVDSRTRDRVEKKLMGGEIKFIDMNTMERFKSASQDVVQDVLLPRDEFEEYAEFIMRTQCKNCGKEGSTCPLNSLFWNSLVPESGHRLPNCPYAYTDSDTDKAISETIARLIELRRTQLTLACDERNASVAPDFLEDVSALNKAIEALLEMKNGGREE